MPELIVRKWDGPYSFMVFREYGLYKARRGDTGEVQFEDPSKSVVIQNAIDSLLHGGTIFLREVQLPSGLTIPTNVLIVEDYQGVRSFYTSRDVYPPAVEEASYTIFKDGTLIKAKNGQTGEVEFSDEDWATVIQQAVNNASGGSVVVKGDIEVSTKISITKRLTYIHYGKATLTGTDPYLEIHVADGVYGGALIYVDYIDGQDKTRDGIVIKDTFFNRIFFNRIANCNYGIHVLGETNVKTNNNNIFGELITGCNDALRFEALTDGEVTGNKAIIGFIALSSVGVRFTGAGLCKYNVVIADIDNLGVDGSLDIVDDKGYNHIITGFIRDPETYSTINSMTRLTRSQPTRFESFIPLVRSADAVIIGNSGDTYASLGTSYWRWRPAHYQNVEKIYFAARWNATTTAAGIRLYNNTDAVEIGKHEPGATGWYWTLVDVTDTLLGYAAEKTLCIQSKGDGATAPEIMWAGLLIVARI